MNNRELSSIMKTAWAVKKSENISMATALRLAWHSFKLKVRMRKEVVKFAFRKMDGTLREAVGTLISTMVPKYERKTDKPHTPNYTTMAYYDMERQSFRCFKVAGLLLP